MNERPQLAAARTPAEIQRSGSLVAKEAGGTTVGAFFEANKDSIKALLPAHMTADRMLKIALRALRTTPKLLECTINSLFGAVVTCAQLGLEPNTPQGHIYLIPFENRRKGIYEVQVILGYKGLLDLSRRSGEIVSISSHAVMKNDVFDVSFGTDESIIHKPKLDGDRGDIVGFYAVAHMKGGGTQFEFMSATDVNKIRDGSQGYKTAIRFNKTDTPWISSYEAMGRKTSIRRLCNYLPMSIELANAVALEGRAERNETQGLDQVLNGDFHVVPDDEGTQGSYDEETGEVTEPTAEPQEQPKRRGRSPKQEAQQVEHKPEAPMHDPSAAAHAEHVQAQRTAEPAQQDRSLSQQTGEYDELGDL